MTSNIHANVGYWTLDLFEADFFGGRGSGVGGQRWWSVVVVSGCGQGSVVSVPSLYIERRGEATRYFCIVGTVIRWLLLLLHMLTFAGGEGYNTKMSVVNFIIKH